MNDKLGYLAVTISTATLNELLKDRIPKGSRIVAVDHDAFVDGIKLLFGHPDYPPREEGMIPYEGATEFTIDNHGITRLTSINSGWSK